MQEIQQVFVTSFITPLLYVLMFCTFITGLKTGWVLRKWSLVAAIACYIFGQSMPLDDIRSIILSGCAFTATLGLLIGYIPCWFKTWGLCFRELRLLFQV
ncbi:hypothetical protein PQG02_31970 (plasmid) [Nostoc sp. UHCC 0926]|nr:hypothetical protein PQG02_31970 [Nostoc sp. UHCC 0926]